ncbi:MAG: ribosomal-protein-alanine N-acetyltransferase [Promethearchaeota archaeon]|nr:MAG: ribosomal-protein-alanine N-acetyltransferase [Candidatus Lokiarchaeota archaeon]
MGTDKDAKANYYHIFEKNDPITIRRCSLEDLEGVIQVNEKELPEDYPYFFYKTILDNYPKSFLVASNHKGKIIGYIMWRVEKIPSLDNLKLENKGHLVSIAISKKYRKRGIASSLLKKSMQEVKKYKIDEYVLEVRVSNYTAIGLYKKFKFNTQSIKSKYYRDGENAYYMTLKVKKS